MKRAFVTGGSGFVGRNLIRRFVGDGVAVVALARSEKSSRQVEALGAEPFAGDLGSENLAKGMAECDVVFHVAALVAEWAQWEEFAAANIEGTRRVVEAAIAAGVPSLVHVSTEAVLLDGRGPIVQVDETHPIPERSGVSLYGESKAAAEEVVRAASDKLKCTIIRPRFVWGRDDTSLMPVVIDAVRSGRLAWIGGGRHLTSTCHVDNLVEALVLAARSAPTGSTYFVTDGEPVEFRDFLTKMLARHDVQAPTRTVPRSVAAGLARVLEAVWRLFRLSGPPPMNRAVVALIGAEVTVRDRRIRDELGFENVITIEEGLETMVEPATA